MRDLSCNKVFFKAVRPPAPASAGSAWSPGRPGISEANHPENLSLVDHQVDPVVIVAGDPQLAEELLELLDALHSEGLETVTRLAGPDSQRQFQAVEIEASPVAITGAPEPRRCRCPAPGTGHRGRC